MLPGLGPAGRFALPLSDDFPLFSLSRADAGGIVAVSKMGKLDSADGDADEVFAFLADQFALGEKFPQIVANAPFDDLPEALVIFLDL